MEAHDAFLLAFDGGWSHRWESLGSALQDVTEEEASWQAPCYRDVPPESGWPEPGTIRWQVAHVAHCKRFYAELLRRVGEEGRPEARPWPGTSSLAEDLALLREAHAEQGEVIASLSGTPLDARVGNGMSLAEFLAMTARHDVWHAAQIAVARRLYATRASPHQG